MGQRKALPGSTSRDKSAVRKQIRGTKPVMTKTNKTEIAGETVIKRLKNENRNNKVEKVAPDVCVFSWRSMLAVVASLPPKQLQKLDSLTTIGSAGGESLSWDDFCGYEDVKVVLKRLLKLSGIQRREDDTVVEGGAKPPVSGGSMTSISDMSNSSATTVTSQAPPRLFPVNDICIKISLQKNQCAATLRESLQVSSDKVRGIVLHGPSGCGKSFLARIIAAEVVLACSFSIYLMQSSFPCFLNLFSSPESCLTFMG